MTNRIIHPEGWAPARGYANGVLTEDGTLYVGGQIGWTAGQVFEAHDFIGQMEQALKNILAVVEAAGGGPEHLTRLTWYVTDKQEYLAHQAEIGRSYRSVFGRNFPAMTMVVVSALVEDEAQIEIEATAKIPQA
ncbi:Enamine deaminase RidA, house cleaning of reactive enamine intermediates, YjgF/YER057c/UK114 family [Lutimaribacter pacificus]|uniref:Enamine deaminase RidA, house cleaning of reactive enamine intermediates, YjgF/YER057c/UK114 family n=1 Tax=Lutimaribacter pacificus TaxID=391948 RepID=A0A1H0D098_9RHOB|nr:RidA family protein [Lutimaribacter pacificus]SDN63528.1 Enamine deaminase RidA, house cleaning of reactive enamine intermediates, YjgF/YER057c/UK114 family [Lutimaribacter pacificus]SHJ38613.1 Enamine deaminase RidA, house cleaning of reactive enamine intermediates, YjgF/YER057c/UK114 family [Lutimaribacter pacificus]